MGKQSKIRRCLSAPARALAKARDFYVFGITEFAGKIGGAGVMGWPKNQPTVPAPTFSRQEDAREIARAAAGITGIGNRPEMDHKRPQAQRAAVRATRNFGVAIGRINEDEEEGEFGEDEDVVDTNPTKGESHSP